jgi:esterase/lipase superfamily enzyme
VLALGGGAPAAGQEGPGEGQAAAARTVDVLYVTDRRRGSGADDGSGYGGERGPVDYGRCSVTYSPIPVLEDLAQRLPFYVPEALQDVRPAPLADAAGLHDAVDRWLRGGEGRKLVLFVHGYSQDFERACRRAGALQRALGPERRVVLFTWPSDGDPTAYASDTTDMEWSIPDLAALVSAFADRFGGRRLQVVAHSLGARAVMLALERLHCAPGARRYVGDLVLIAPDIDRDIFLQRYGGIRRLTGPVTLYVSENDAAMALSRRLHGHPRLGQGGEYLTVAAGMETVDVTPIGRYQITGHEYHYYHPRVARDLRERLSGGLSAEARTGLEPRTRGGRRWWSMQPLDEVQ